MSISTICLAWSIRCYTYSLYWLDIFVVLTRYISVPLLRIVVIHISVPLLRIVVLDINEDQQYLIDLGLIRVGKQALEIANPIYREVIPKRINLNPSKYVGTRV